MTVPVELVVDLLLVLALLVADELAGYVALPLDDVRLLLVGGELVDEADAALAHDAPHERVVGQLDGVRLVEQVDHHQVEEHHAQLGRVVEQNDRRREEGLVVELVEEAVALLLPDLVRLGLDYCVRVAEIAHNK